MAATSDFHNPFNHAGFNAASFYSLYSCFWVDTYNILYLRILPIQNNIEQCPHFHDIYTTGNIISLYTVRSCDNRPLVKFLISSDGLRKHCMDFKMYMHLSATGTLKVTYVLPVLSKLLNVISCSLFGSIYVMVNESLSITCMSMLCKLLLFNVLLKEYQD